MGNLNSFIEPKGFVWIVFNSKVMQKSSNAFNIYAFFKSLQTRSVEKCISKRHVTDCFENISKILCPINAFAKRIYRKKNEQSGF